MDNADLADYVTEGYGYHIRMKKDARYVGLCLQNTDMNDDG